LRLIAHRALRSPSLIDNFEARVGDVEGLTASVRRTIGAMDSDWASALTLVTAEMAAEPGEFRSRLTAAAKDVQALVTSDELPTWDDFAEGPAGSAWPPLTLGVLPILGGRFSDNPREDWEVPVGGGGLATFAVCAVGFGPGSREFWLCTIGVLAVLIIVAAIAA
jgi:hypothetical protein